MGGRRTGGKTTPLNDDERAAVRRFLDQHNTLTLATSGDGMPWAATVFFASDADLNLYFVSDHRTRHGRDMAANPAVVATVNPDCDDWRDIRGLQIRGAASVVEGLARAKALTLYLAKFPQIDALFNRPGDAHEETIAQRLKATNFYRIVPDWIRFIDNSKGFGAREEYDL